MCFIAFLVTLFALAPRALNFFWWLADSYRFLTPFNGMLALPLLGMLFMPWTTLAYVFVWSPSSGPYGPDLIVLGIGLAADVAQHVGTWFNYRRIVGVMGDFWTPKAP